MFSLNGCSISHKVLDGEIPLYFEVYHFQFGTDVSSTKKREPTNALQSACCTAVQGAKLRGCSALIDQAIS